MSQSPAEQPWPAYTVERKPLAWLKPNAKNARTHSKEQLAQLRSSIKEFGWTVPVLAREDGTIIAGHGRIDAAKLEGITEAPVIIATGWTEQQCRAYALADNRIALNSGWDTDLLGAELIDLGGLGVDLGGIGFSPQELNEYLNPNGGGLTDPDDVPEPPAQPVSRLGDLWVLGRHRSLCGDSTKAEDVARVLGGVKPHLMVTDPPYGVNYDPNWRNDAAQAGATSLRGAPGGRAVGKVQGDTRSDWRDASTLFPGHIAYVWHGGLHAAAFAESLAASGHYHWKHEPCWYAVRKGETGAWSGDRSQMTVWDIEHLKSDTGHGTQKPVECMKRPIENNSSPGQAVYDPFVGSGTTIIAAEMTGRACIAIDCDPVYVDVAVLRWQKFTGEKATLDGDGRDFESVAAERVPKAA